MRKGHKFALSGPLKFTLQDLILATYDKYKCRFQDLLPAEGANLENWKRQLCKDAAALQEDKPPRLLTLVREWLRHPRDMGAAVKSADKNLGVVPIRKDIYNHLMHTNLKSKTYQRVVIFLHADISRRLRSILISRKDRLDRQALEWIDFAAQAKDPCPFYVIPKLHKGTLRSRPITAQHSYMLAPLSKKLAAVQQREVDLIPEVAKDSKGVMQELE